jgi:hypothetical protein
VSVKCFMPLAISYENNGDVKNMGKYEILNAMA